MSGPRRRYRFVIDESFTPDTLPMSRLAEYMTDLADLLGEKSYVHFVAVESGSAALVQEIEHEAYPKVRTRIHDVKRGEGPADARRAYDMLNRKLADDNASGALVEELEPNAPLARVLDFPGRKRFVEAEYGPLTEPGTLQGVVIVVGGESDPVPIHLQDHEQVYLCRAKRPLAKELAGYIFGPPVRVQGNGRWFRDETGTWILKTFTIASFTPLEDETLSTVIAKLRQIPAKWTARTDALTALGALRSDEA